MIRWAWRLFRREWRQQLLILLLVIVAVAAVVVGAAVAVNTPPPANAGYGTAEDLATFTSSGKQPPNLHSVAAQIAALEHRFGTVQVIENETFHVPGSTQTYQLRSQDPHGPYGGPMLQLLSGHYPTGPDQIALTPGLASELNLSVGDTWPQGGKTVVGIVQNPQSLLDEFALVPPGQVTHPTAGGRALRRTGRGPGPDRVQRLDAGLASTATRSTPTTIVLALATVGMLLIALVSVGGFTVLAQRRLRALGMLESMGATDRNVRLVLRANGVIVGAVGAVVGFALGLVAWLAYRPHNEQSAHHLIPMFALPWTVIVVAMVLAVVATFFAAGHPARAITRVPVVSALAGRPAPPRQIHRSFVPGVIALVIGFVMFSLSGAAGNGGGVIWLMPGFVALIVGIILVAPFFLALLARVGTESADRHPLGPARPLAVPGPVRLGPLGHQRRRVDRGGHLRRRRRPLQQRLRLRRAEPGVERAGRLEPERPERQRPPIPTGRRTTPPSIQSQEAGVHSIASAGRRPPTSSNSTIPSVGLQNPSASGRQWSGPIYVATPALLRAYGINPSSVPSNVDILSSRPGLSGSGVQLTYGGGGKGGGLLVGPAGAGGGGPGPGNTNTCSPGSCVAHPVIQEESQLPTGTSAPNTVITESALRRLHLASQSSLDGWILQANSPITSAQITQRPSDGGYERPEHRVEERRPVLGRDRQLGHRVRHRTRPRHPGHEHGPHP